MLISKLYHFPVPFFFCYISNSLYPWFVRWTFGWYAPSLGRKISEWSNQLCWQNQSSLSWTYLFWVVKWTKTVAIKVNFKRIKKEYMYAYITMLSRHLPNLSEQKTLSFIVVWMKISLCMCVCIYIYLSISVYLYRNNAPATEQRGSYL